MKLIKLVAVPAIMAIAASAMADTVNGNGGLGTYYGSGNPQDGWTVTTTGNIELGLRGQVYQGGIPETSPGVYTFNQGISPANSARDTWNFNFSINVGANSDLGRYTFALLIDSDPSAGTSFTTINPATAYGDNEYAIAGSNAAKSVGLGAKTLADYSVVQNSENAAFGLPVGYNPNIPGDYTITLEVLNSDKTVIASDSIDIQVVPDASSTLPLLGAAVMGLAFIRRSISK